MADKAALQAERDSQSDIAQAIRETEEEIFADAMGSDEPDREGDTELEQQDEDRLEGDETVDDDIDESPEEVPDRVREEHEEPAAEADPRDAQIAELRAQVQALSQRMAPQQPQFQPQPQWQPQQPQPQQWQQPQAPQQLDPYRNPHDMVLEPEKWNQYQVAANQQIAAQAVQAAEERRVNALMMATQQGPRGTEFQAAYNQLQMMPLDNAKVAIVDRIRYSADPGQALLDWWETTPQAQQFADAEAARMTERLEQMGYRVSPSGGRQAPRGQPRQATRIPPSLNAIPGGRSHRASDGDNTLRMGDSVDGLSLGDDGAIFANVWRS